MLRGQRLENDMVALFVNHSARSLVDIEIFSQPSGNHDLSFHGEHHSVGFGCWSHNNQYYISTEGKSNGCLLEMARGLVNLTKADRTAGVLAGNYWFVE